MDKDKYKVKRLGRIREGLCILLTAILAVCWIWAVFGAENVLTQNSSGNQNRKLSVDPIRKNEGYATALYDIRNGLPTSEANAIAQTGDGFLWIGSYAGLIRYDGNTFERIGSTTGLSSVRCLYVDSQDRLWIGTNDAGVFLMVKDELRNWNKASGIASVSVRVVIEDEEGMIYIGSTAGVAMIDREMNLTVLEDERIASLTIKDFRLGADGLIYGLTQSGDIFTMKNGRLVTFLAHEQCRVEGVRALLPDPKHPGNLYLGVEGSRVCHGSLEDNFATLGVKDITPLSHVECLENINGEIWLCASNGIGRLDSLGFHKLSNVPMNNMVGHVMTDYEGNLWFSSTRQGIMKIVPNQFSDLFERYGLSPAVVNTTCMCGKQLFLGTDDGLIVLENRDRVGSLPLTEAVTASGEDLGTKDLLDFLKGERIRSIIRDSKGRLWISTWRSCGLLCYEQGKVTAFTQAEGLFSNHIRVVSECENGNILVANTGGVSIIEGNRVTGAYGEKDGIVNGEVLTVTEGFGGEIILGTDGGGIYILDDHGIKHIGTEEGLSSEVILRIKRSDDRQVYWIVTSNSLAYMTSDFQVSTVRQFPYPNNYDLYENSRGDIWVLSSSGIYVVPEEALLANGAIEPVFYGISSGLPYMATANSFSEQTAEGDLYIASSMGVVKVNMEIPFEDIHELKVSLPYVDADGTRYYPDAQGDFALPSMVRKLTIYPYVFNYSLVDPQVSYRLEGFDLENTNISRSKLLPVDYTNLRFGAFRFILTVKDPIGLDEQTVSFRIVNGKEMTAGTIGTFIMIFTSLLLVGGILVYTSPYRNRNHLEDQLLFGLILSNAALSVGEMVSLLLEYVTIPFGRVFIVAGNTVYYLALVFFPYLLWIYLEYRRDPDMVRIKKRMLLFGIPGFFYLAVMVINLKTGWFFSVSERNMFRLNLHGEGILLPVLPICFYLLLSLGIVFRVKRHLAVLGAFLIAGRLVGHICFRDISSTSLFYSLMLVYIHLYVMYQPKMKEVAL